MKYSISLVENETYIRTNILQALKPLVNSALDSCILKVRSPLVQLIKNALMGEPEYSSLISGTLRAEFGIADISNVDIAIENIANSIIINKNSISINNLGLSGGLELKLINHQDFGGALSDQSAFVVDTDRGYSLPWLEWLLLKGNNIIVKNYAVKYTNSPKSRSGSALMVDSNTSWRVPPEYAGTIRDNWTTRALNRVDNDVIKIIRESFESSI